MRRLAVLLALAPILAAGCGMREAVPSFRADDARFGRLGGGAEAPSIGKLCADWESAVSARDESAVSHVSFPETNVQDACFTPVTHAGRDVHVDRPPRGCGYPDAGSRARLELLADALERADAGTAKLFPCTI